MRTRFYHAFPPQRLYALCGRISTPCGLLATFCLLIGWVWGLAFAPADYQQGDSFRIMYMHVPAAIGSLSIYLLMALAAFIGLVWQKNLASLAAMAMAPVGAVFTFIALCTGSLWGKPMWGAWWVWDARLTSELVLLFLYIGAIALYQAFDNRRQGGKAASLLILVGVVNIPIIHYSVEWWYTLHQGSTQMQQTISPLMRQPLRWCIVGYQLLFAALTLMRLRNLILYQERHQDWVSVLAQKERRGERL
ncbi:heme ABC transporter permease [Affinibrenneria salicis]|uniref:Heme exporter protein C n=1 Tax=Affinibrenneria salicis TaxID=2590031 RepID=A0A5J5FUI6_9GAMM|nr:heme ABC transporter permease [Affinibrenneria salicis]KAA8996937.1 heme ABC transporter permease [Affinibrenneria salicis]